jgi:hypothetical protein
MLFPHHAVSLIRRQYWPFEGKALHWSRVRKLETNSKLRRVEASSSGMLLISLWRVDFKVRFERLETVEEKS